MNSICDKFWSWFIQWFWNWNPKYNIVRRYTGISNNVHKQKFIFSCHDKVKSVVVDGSSYFNMVLQPKSLEEAQEFSIIHTNICIDIIVKVT